MAHTDPELDEVWQRFHDVVNIPSPELRDWLAAAEDMPGEFRTAGEADLPELGRHVLAIVGKRRTDVTEADRQVMSQVADLVEGWLANPPAERAADDDWRHALMTVGHDPLRAG